MDNGTKLEKANLHDFYYYKKFSDGSRITVCILVRADGAFLARGLSICSKLDQFDKRKGRAVALGRAIQAWYHSCSMLPINPRAFSYGHSRALELNGLGKFKATYLPQAAAHEQEILAKVH